MARETTQSIILPAVKRSDSLALAWQVLALGIAFAILCFAAWLSYSPLLETPSDVMRSRDVFSIATEIFQKNPKYWHTKRQQMEEKIEYALSETSPSSSISFIHEITPEMLIALAANTFKKESQSSSSLAFTTKISGSSLLLLLSKYDQNAWPLPILLSLEIEIRFLPSHIELFFHRLRRGSQELSAQETRSYFGSELDLLKKTGTLVLKSPLGAR